jgi:DNA-binding transcriptional ArsR family regulator
MENTKVVKVTKKDNFEALKLIVEVSGAPNAEALTQFIDHEIELLNKKHSSGKLTATQVENETIKTKIVEALAEVGKPVTVTELLKLDGLDYSSQKISALLKQLKDAGKVVSVKEKKVTYFSLVDTETDAE